MPSKGNYVCVKCEIELRPEKNGVYVEEHRGHNQPYKIWHADLLACPICDFQIITGFGRNRLAEHYETEKYEKLLPRVNFHIRGTQ